MIDSALKAGRNKRVGKRKSDTPLSHSRKKERERLQTITQNATDALRSIPKRFPSIDELSEFYRELMKNDIDLDQYRESLARIQNSSRAIQTIKRSVKGKIEAAQSVDDIKEVMRRFIGRFSGAIDRLDTTFTWLEGVRKTLRSYPKIKETFTVAIAGFPNVGKSTLLKRITGSDVEVAGYAFTTKRLNVGIKRIKHHNVQFIDTPGTLNRDHMNAIERQAHLAQKYVADVIVYVYDATEPYPLVDQESLREHTKQYGKPIVNYLSKTDLLSEKQIASFGHEVVSYDNLVKEIESYM